MLITPRFTTKGLLFCFILLAGVLFLVQRMEFQSEHAETGSPCPAPSVSHATNSADAAKDVAVAASNSFSRGKFVYPSVALCFGQDGPVRLDAIPAGAFKSELVGLQSGPKEFALRKLGELRIPVPDIASLHVDHTGHLYYECKPPSQKRLSGKTAAILEERALGLVQESAALLPVSSPPIRHSRPAASRVIYLDFNGHAISGTEWNTQRGSSGDANYRPAVATYVAKPFSVDSDYTTFNDEEQLDIIRIWERVAEDYKPFDVDVTTEEPATFTVNTGRILITESVDANAVTMPGGATSAGIAYIDVFGDFDYITRYSPALIYADQNYNYEDYIAEVASHEMGHNLSLSHDGQAGTEYYEGHGLGDTSWGPIMGAPYDMNVTQWSKGEYFNASNTQDDLVLIAGHLGYVADDYPDTNGGATSLTAIGSSVTGAGLISSATDADRFRFNAGAGTFSLTVTPFRSGGYSFGGNLDVSIQLLNAAGAVVAQSNSDDHTSATIITSQTAGVYYLRVSSSGAGAPFNNPPTGYTAYGSLGQYTIAGTVPASSAAVDFNGDGKADILWQNRTTGERLIWLMNGSAVSSGVGLNTVSPEWVMATTGDFNSDGKADVVWENTATGERKIWLMDGTNVNSSISLSTVSREWKIAASGDFNKDGKPDLVWQNTLTGERSIWLMNGTTVLSGVGLGTISPEWWIAGTGDFNRDSETDIYWQNTVTGQHLVWYMNGTTVTSGVGLASYRQISIAGFGDYNGDGYPDMIVTNNITGERQIWILNGVQPINATTITTLSLDWVLCRPIPGRTYADFNRDGKTDVIWQNTGTGERLIWLMNGTSVGSGVALSTVPVQWVIAATGDFNNDSKSDLVWQNTVTGERTIWLMNGATVSTGVGLGITSPDWSIGGSGDFNNDGKSDLVLQNTSTNEAVVWIMDGTARTYISVLGSQPSFRVAAVGDFNADGNPDIVWRNPSTGAHKIHLMTGTTFSNEIQLGTFGPEWSVVGSGDFNQDGKSDLLWQNSVTGERLIWLMSGTTVSTGIGLGTYPLEWSLRN